MRVCVCVCCAGLPINVHTFILIFHRSSQRNPVRRTQNGPHAKSSNKAFTRPASPSCPNFLPLLCRLRTCGWILALGIPIINTNDNDNRSSSSSSNNSWRPTKTDQSRNLHLSGQKHRSLFQLSNQMTDPTFPQPPAHSQGSEPFNAESCWALEVSGKCTLPWTCPQVLTWR